MHCHFCGTFLLSKAAGEILRCPGCQCFRIAGLPDATPGVVVPLAPTGQHRCPTCRGTLCESAIDGLRAESCSKCRALLMPASVFAMYIRNRRDEFRDAATRPFPRLPLPGPYNCPACRRSLKTHPCLGPDGMTLHECWDCDLVWIADLLVHFACPAELLPDDLEMTWSDGWESTNSLRIIGNALPAVPSNESIATSHFATPQMALGGGAG